MGRFGVALPNNEHGKKRPKGPVGSEWLVRPRLDGAAATDGVTGCRVRIIVERLANASTATEEEPHTEDRSSNHLQTPLPPISGAPVLALLVLV